MLNLHTVEFYSFLLVVYLLPCVTSCYVAELYFNGMHAN